MSLPAAVRWRWGVDQMIVVDLGDRIVLRPLPEDLRGSQPGKYRALGPSTDQCGGAEPSQLGVFVSSA